MIRFKSLTTRFGAIVVGVSLVTTLCTGGGFMLYATRENKQILTDYRQALRNSTDDKLVAETQTALSLIEAIYAKQQAGQLTEDEAKKMAAEHVRALRYDDGAGYFWIDTYDGVNVVMIDSAVEGRSRMELYDHTGRFFIKEMIANGQKEGGGFTDILYPRPNERVPLPKRNYTVSFAPYGWVIGTGMWIDQIDTTVMHYEESLSAKLRDGLRKMLLFLIGLQILFVTFAVYAGRSLVRPIRFMTEWVRSMGNSDFSMDERTEARVNALTARNDELGFMSNAMKEMHDKLYEYQKAILDMARKDALTGLANRRYFNEYMMNFRDKRNLTLIMLDLDHFKEVNDNFDHQTGDAALLILAEMLKVSFSDALNVRMGGDEFLVALTKKIELSEVESRLVKFMDQLVAIYQTDPELSRLTISAGIAGSPDEDLPLDILMQQSDLALYQAKQYGRSCYCVYHADMEKKE